MLKVRITRTPFRHLCFDLENRPSAYWYDGQTTAEITAFGWKWDDRPDVQTMILCGDGMFELDDGTKVPYGKAYELFRAEMTGAGVVYGHNIRKHDLPMLQSGFLRLQQPLLPALRTTDTLKDIPKRGLLSASLENLASLYGLEGEKFSMSQPMWEKANRLTPDGTALARRRVASDVLLQAALRDKLRELGLLRPPKVWRP